MHTQRSSSRFGAILSLLGGALVIFGVLYLPMVHGNGGGDATIPVSEWVVADFFFRYAFPPTAVLLAFPLLVVLFVLGTSAASLFRELSPGLVTWRRRAALAGLVIQGVLGFFMVSIYTFGPVFGVGFWIVLLGFVVMMVGTWFNSPRPVWVERRISRVQSRR
jgi:hypothetical protein